ncbi:MAG: hypothetical protein GKB99_04625 [Methanocellales archaeon]|nr:hypothetical protein [Methanocellales archaeon]
MSEKETKKGVSITSFLAAPQQFMGKSLDRLLPLFNDLKANLLRANIKISFPTYVSYNLFFPSVSLIAIIATVPVIAFMYGESLLLSIFLGLSFGLLSWAIVFAIIYVYPSNLASSRKKTIEEELPYLSSHMAVLSQGGLPPERIFRSLSMLDTKEIKSVMAEEATNIVRDVAVLGCDIITSMEKSIERSPSKKFTDFIRGFIAVTRSGGDMTRYFLMSARSLMDSAKIAAKELTDNLGIVAEFYVALMIVFPLLVLIMLSVMGIIGGSIGGISIMMTMNLVSYIAVPISAMFLIVYLDTIMPPK